MSIRQIEETDRDEWLRLRRELWPDIAAETHHEKMTRILTEIGQHAVFGCSRAEGGLTGFLEMSIHLGPESNTTRDIVAHIEGWYVEPGERQHGIGRSLILAAEKWARSIGCSSLTSDAEVHNQAGQEAHHALGFEETRRLVHFRKVLR